MYRILAPDPEVTGRPSHDAGQITNTKEAETETERRKKTQEKRKGQVRKGGK